MKSEKFLKLKVGTQHATSVLLICRFNPYPHWRGYSPYLLRSRGRESENVGRDSVPLLGAKLKDRGTSEAEGVRTNLE